MSEPRFTLDPKAEAELSDAVDNLTEQQRQVAAVFFSIERIGSANPELPAGVIPPLYKLLAREYPSR